MLGAGGRDTGDTLGQGGTGDKGCWYQCPPAPWCRARCRCGWTSSPPASAPLAPPSTSPPASPRGEHPARGQGHAVWGGRWHVPVPVPLQVRAALRGVEHAGRGPEGHQRGRAEDERHLRHRVSHSHHRGLVSGMGTRVAATSCPPRGTAGGWTGWRSRGRGRTCTTARCKGTAASTGASSSPSSTWWPSGSASCPERCWGLHGAGTGLGGGHQA